MLRVALVNMPFSSASLPSIALAQLRSVLAANLGDQVETQVLHVNHDLARHLGLELYEQISARVEAVTSGLGDWLFREQAFPGLPDNSALYFRRHLVQYQRDDPRLKTYLLAKRQVLGEFLERMIDVYRLDTYQVVGFTSMFSQNTACFAMARALKRRNPQVITVLGGANCEGAMGRVIAQRIEAIDFVFSGPALRNFPELVDRLASGRESACHELRGVYSRQSLAASTAGPARAVEIGDELDIEIDVPLDYDDFLESVDDKLEGKVEPEILFETSRGCWWGERSHCTFCGLNGATMKYRAMSPDKALAYIGGLLDRYAGRVSRFQSVDNIMPRQYLTEVFPRLRPPRHVRFFYEVKADLKEREMEVLARAGVTLIQPGIEAMATSTLALMKKGTTSFQNIKFLKGCLTYGISPNWNLLIGFPGEAVETYRKYTEDLPLLAHLPPPNGPYPVRFDRFSPYFKEAESYGLRLRPCDFYGMVYPLAESELRELAYFFVDENYAATYLSNTAQWVGRLGQRLEDWRARWDGARGNVPKLVFRSAGAARWVYDTRRGTAIEHRLSARGLRLLDLLVTQKRLAHLAEKLPDVPLTELEQELAELQRRGLIFQEDDFFISLVMEEAPRLAAAWQETDLPAASAAEAQSARGWASEDRAS